MEYEGVTGPRGKVQADKMQNHLIGRSGLARDTLDQDSQNPFTTVLRRVCQFQADCVRAISMEPSEHERRPGLVCHIKYLLVILLTIDSHNTC